MLINKKRMSGLGKHMECLEKHIRGNKQMIIILFLLLLMLLVGGVVFIGLIKVKQNISIDLNLVKYGDSLGGEWECFGDEEIRYTGTIIYDNKGLRTIIMHFEDINKTFYDSLFIINTSKWNIISKEVIEKTNCIKSQFVMYGDSP